MQVLTQSVLLDQLSYDPDTGIFRNRKTRNASALAGEIAGSINASGYWRIGFGGKGYRAHRLAWLYVYGVWPKNELDHINCIRTDNRISNLREATRHENQQNKTKAHRNSNSGLLGARYQQGVWYSSINIDKKNVYLGRFKSAELANAAYIKAKRELHPFSTI